MTQPRRTRRRIDALIAAVIAIGVITTVTAVYLGSDVRATTLVATPAAAVSTTPPNAKSVPASLHEIWQLSTDPRFGAVVTPYGAVATADTHSVRGFDTQDGTSLWSYTRSNRALCAIGSGDTTTDALDSWSGVHGVMTVFAKNGYCSQVTLFDPTKGERLYQRTSPNQDPGQLFFGSPYVGWMGSDYLELWRHDLVATIRYGNQPNPVNSNGPHVGCTFTDAAVTADQLATIEHCGSVTNLVLNWPTPSDSPAKGDKGWDTNNSVPKATIALKSSQAVILEITADRAAVLVAEPAPAIVVYDTTGKEISRTTIHIDAADISATAKAGVTPSVTYQDHHYALVGHTLFAMSSTTETVPAPPKETAANSSATGGDHPSDNAGAATSAGSTKAPATVDVDSPVFDWSMTKVLGLPASIETNILVPISTGLAVRPTSSSRTTRVIPVDRGGYQGRVDVTAVGSVVVEVRGAHVVGLAARTGS
ncbi:MAG: hypothetical protein ABI382_04055 [Nakamurella sp.]